MSCVIALNSSLNLTDNTFLSRDGATAREASAQLLMPFPSSGGGLAVQLDKPQPKGNNGYKFTMRFDGKDTPREVVITDGNTTGNFNYFRYVPRLAAISIHVSTIGTPEPSAGKATLIIR